MRRASQGSDLAKAPMIPRIEPTPKIAQNGMWNTAFTL